MMTANEKEDILNIILKISQHAIEHIMERKTYSEGRKDIPPMILVEIVQLVVDIDRLLHSLLNLVKATREHLTVLKSTFFRISTTTSLILHVFVFSFFFFFLFYKLRTYWKEQLIFKVLKLV
ncbi:hypothetical protein V6Z12_A10G106100 [Gossypium hirsutum]